MDVSETFLFKDFCQGIDKNPGHMPVSKTMMKSSVLAQLQKLADIEYNVDWGTHLGVAFLWKPSPQGYAYWNLVNSCRTGKPQFPDNPDNAPEKQKSVFEGLKKGTIHVA